jgi:uncharacterized membrane protein YwaF
MLAIKNAGRFVQWQWRRLETIPKLTLSALIMVLLSFVTIKYSAVSNAFLIAAIILLVATLGSFIHMILKEQYAKFKAERQALFDTIKHSDKQNKK